MNCEPQIIHYYHDFPSYAYIIDILNHEYDELQCNYSELSSEFTTYKRDYPLKIINKKTDTNKNIVLLFFMVVMFFEMFIIICYV